MINRKYIFTNPRWLTQIVLPLIIAIILTLGSLLLLDISNKGSQTLYSVFILLKEHRYPLGDIKPGETKSIVLKPNRESHIEIEHDKKHRKRIKIDCYIEKGYKGKLKIELTSTKLLKAKDNTSI